MLHPGYTASTQHPLGEAPLSSDTFYGGAGLCTFNGIKKPSYYAFDLLSRLGNQLIAHGESYVVTKHKNDIQILFYNYCHYSVLYAKGENFDKSFSNRRKMCFLLWIFSEKCVNLYYIGKGRWQDES